MTSDGYGRRYAPVAVPDGLQGETLRQYVSRMSWYHAIDLGGGVVTPGLKPVEAIDAEWRSFGLEDLSGRTLVDIGGVDGGYAFRAESAGARRAAVLDHYLWSIDPDAYGRLYHAEREAGRVPPAPHESELWDPDGLPGRWRIDTAIQVLGSQVETIVADFMDVDLDAVGVWDVVLYLGVLYHMEDPVRALRRVFAVTGEQAIVETEAVIVAGHVEPLWRFFPGGELNFDRSNWWAPNLAALLGLLGAVGFRDAEVISGEPPASGAPLQHYRAVVRAIR